MLCLSITSNFEELEPLSTAPQVERENAIENVEALNEAPANNQVNNDPENAMDISYEDLDKSF